MKNKLCAWLRGAGEPTAVDQAYRKTTNRLGAVLLLFWLLYFFLPSLLDPLAALLSIPLSDDAAYAVESLFSSLDYLLTFMLPCALFYLITPKRERVPMGLSPRIPLSALWLIFAGIAINSTCASINAWVVDLFGYGTFSSDVLWEESTLQDFEGVLLFISTAIVPAFAEELLFRGIVCNNLRPYGKTVAILGSAVLFGMMHSNVGQLFYTTMAGVILAVLYLETGTIWASVMMHLFNNFSSVIYNILADRLDVVSAYRLMGVWDLLTLGGGMMALVLVVLRAERRRGRGEGTPSLADGRWQEQLPEGSTVSPAYRVRYFLSPLMLAFLIVAAVMMFWLLALALRYVYG